MPLILDGRKVQAELAVDLARRIGQLTTPPTLAIIQVGENESSSAYIKQKQIFGAKIGALVKHYHLPAATSQAEVEKLIEELNESPHHQGLIIQLPLPAHLNSDDLIEKINPTKDVDGLNSQTKFMPATARGVLALLDFYKIAVAGKKVTVIGRSKLVGKPLALALMNNGATVTVAHRQTADLAAATRTAELIIVAAGQPKLLRAEHLTPGGGQVVIDVGISRADAGQLVGDVNYQAVAPLVAAISPVPGGVGPLTVASLFANLLDSANTL